MEIHSIEYTDGRARAGKLVTDHGPVPTPAFMPVGTAGTVKGLLPAMIGDVGAAMILANTYHLMLRPGADVVAALGGVHRLMGWNGPILTDSGGYQVFSLAHLRKLDDSGVSFRSHIDGDEARLTPSSAVEIQHKLGSDIMMQLDECPAGDADRETVASAVDRSARWASLCRDKWDELGRISASGDAQSLFAIQQGGIFPDLRAESARRIVELDLPGYAIGGLSVGEGHDAMVKVLDYTDEQFPVNKPRYLMGVGEPRDIIAAVGRGIDMFDCVMPTRNGRNAQAFTFTGKLRLRNSVWQTNDQPIENGCACYACQQFSRGAIRHFFMAREMLGPILVSIHNLHFMNQLMVRLRLAIEQGRFESEANTLEESIYTAGT